MEWKEFSILAHFNVVFILCAVNKAAFDQMHKLIEKKVVPVAISLFK